MMKISYLKMKKLINKLTLAQRTYVLKDGSVSIRPLSFAWIYLTIIFLIVIFFYQFIIGKYFEIIGFAWFVSRIPNFFTILQSMLTNIDFSYIPNMIEPLLDTIKMAFIGTLLGSIISLPVAFLASQNMINNRIMTSIVKFFLSLVRTLPSILYALIFAFIFGYGTFVGALSLTVFTFAISTKLLYESIETLDLGAFQAIQSAGATKSQAFAAGILPQIYGQFVSIVLYSFEINMRYSAILGFVGAGGIGILLNDAMSLRDYGKVSIMLVGFLILVLVTENLSRYVRKKLGQS
ncbi:MAG: hypothetical protein RLZZ264_538 [Bacillota bacterium]